jgi:hypothetical protein
MGRVCQTSQSRPLTSSPLAISALARRIAMSESGLGCVKTAVTDSGRGCAGQPAGSSRTGGHGPLCETEDDALIDYALIAAMSGPGPMMFMTRVRLYASTCSAISALTRFSVFIRKWVAPILALIVPKGCSTVSRR